MIKHHPNAAILKDFVDGNLADSVSLIVSSHVELCEHCQKQVSTLTAQAADSVFESDTSAFENDTAELKLSDSEMDAFLSDYEEFDFDAIDQITADLSQAVEVVVEAQQETVSNTTFTIPRALNSVVRKDWMNLGKISRARLDFDDESHHTSLLHIDKDGQVPCHTHKGFEITLLLEGSFEDEMGVYNKGDFIWLDGEHTHQPATKEGCVCLTVSSDALYFTKGVSQLFNPLGKYIY
ncbi:putative transcriptional regulator [Vibrio crassostreae]|uniref:ChrR family anti-sigma-E factor n=1 Tax=Vibrio crassostreae TaxID=246167 RepID=UPI001B30056B|nr:ChrR family anti-sigma-E factor [Vibrio crassostreae]CAK1700055.1 putative transcriptional regulator [Vibrio crassostreae]CAK1700229.1 putative transcriptional regulator [Vibrio crassostreae]CAK1880733.1 putative transcriptional regulator [Vibrio crassostreae]CAK1975247.1 putative transcriptional regulator [Vibrio crassostreae]CAK1975457.1 putative transcriptional regulator [Vibrio crassostreae]